MTSAPATPPFADLLPDAHAAGLVTLALERCAALQHTAAELDFQTWSLSLRDTTDEAALMQGLGEHLSLPAWFGHNRDALADCLQDLSWCEAPGYLLLLSDFAGFATRQPEAAQALLDILADTASIWADDAIPFWVVFAGDAPSGLPRLAAE